MYVVLEKKCRKIRFGIMVNTNVNPFKFRIHIKKNKDALTVS